MKNQTNTTIKLFTAILAILLLVSYHGVFAQEFGGDMSGYADYSGSSVNYSGTAPASFESVYPVDNFQSTNNSDFSSVAPYASVSITPVQMGSASPESMESAVPNTFTGTVPADFNSETPNSFVSVTPVGMGSVSPESMESAVPNTFTGVTPGDFNSVTPSQMESVSPEGMESAVPNTFAGVAPVTFTPGYSNAYVSPVSYSGGYGYPYNNPIGMTGYYNNPLVNPLQWNTNVNNPVVTPTTWSTNVNNPAVTPTTWNVNVTNPSVNPISIGGGGGGVVTSPISLGSSLFYGSPSPISTAYAAETPTTVPTAYAAYPATGIGDDPRVIIFLAFFVGLSGLLSYFGLKLLAKYKMFGLGSTKIKLKETNSEILGAVIKESYVLLFGISHDAPIRERISREVMALQSLAKEKVSADEYVVLKNQIKILGEAWNDPAVRYLVDEAKLKELNEMIFELKLTMEDIEQKPIENLQMAIA